MKISDLEITVERYWMKELSMINGMLTLELERILTEKFNGEIVRQPEETNLLIQNEIDTFTTKVLNAISKQ